MKAHSINPRAVGTNSVTNAILAFSRQPKPEVGMGATIVMYTDLYPATIVEVTHSSVTIQEDVATRTDKNGLSESQDYTYTTNPKARREVFSLRDTGRYVKRGQPTNGGTHLVIGTREQYVDPSF